MSKTRRAARTLLALVLLCAATPAYAETITLEGWGPFPLRPGDILRAEFDLRGIAAYTPLERSETLLFDPGISVREPIGSYTTRLYDRGRLLGTYTGPPPSGDGLRFRSWFASPGSIFTFENPTRIDFSTFREGTFDGAVEFEIGSGLANVYRASDELDLGYALSPTVATGSGFAPRTFEMIVPTPVPEPGSLLLVATGAGYVLRRRYSRRRGRESGAV